MFITASSIDKAVFLFSQPMHHFISILRWFHMNE
jgi:hypothetical protein